MNLQTLQTTAKAMVTKGKGLLAADESTGTCNQRFKKVGIEQTSEQRRVYRDLLLTSPGLSSYISGAILFDETIRQTTLSGTSFPQYLEMQGILAGIKVDAGAKDLAGHPGEKVTEGLDGLRERLAEYKSMGARFAKWRAVISINPGIPSHACIQANAHALARYAALTQEADLVPIVEPEVLIDGDHKLDRCYETTRAVLRRVFSELAGQGIAFEGMILKASMVITGQDSRHQASVEDVARETVRCLLNTVPPAVAGIAFLSGGQGNEQATAHLNAM
ncbi:MAG: class I fructose-bisphosphate aldolase, partial [Sulfuricaulis sp.]